MKLRYLVTVAVADDASRAEVRDLIEHAIIESRRLPDNKIEDVTVEDVTDHWVLRP